MTKRKSLPVNKVKHKVVKHKKSKNLVKNKSKQGAKGDSFGHKKIEVAIPFDQVVPSLEPEEYLPVSELISKSQEDAAIVIQRWWRSMLSLKEQIQEYRIISQEDSKDYDEVKRKKLKHSFSFGMDPNHTNISSNSTSSNAMFGCINSKDIPMFQSQGLSEEYTNYKEKENTKKCSLSKESDLNPLLTGSTQEVKPEIDINSIEL